MDHQKLITIMGFCDFILVQYIEDIEGDEKIAKTF